MKKVICVLAMFAVLGLLPGKAALFSGVVVIKQQEPKKLTEQQKIENLIAFIAKQDGVFIRNGSEYTPAQAAEHLRMKWRKAGGAIKTADDFIEKLASSSSMSGKPYQIKFKNGQVLNVGILLKAELKRMNG